MSTIHPRGGDEIAFVKGAPKEVLGLCTSILVDGAGRADDGCVARARSSRRTTPTPGGRCACSRSLAACCRSAPNGYTVDWVERELTFLGLMAMQDPPRPEVAEAVEQVPDGRDPHHHDHGRLRTDGGVHRAARRHRAEKERAS